PSPKSRHSVRPLIRPSCRCLACRPSLIRGTDKFGPDRESHMSRGPCGPYGRTVKTEDGAMPDVLLEVAIAATPDQVNQAITEEQGLSSWWTPEVTAKPEVGSVAEFVFTGGPGGRIVVKMEITALEPGRAVRWAVRQGVPEWAGTHITWDLTPVDQ